MSETSARWRGEKGKRKRGRRQNENEPGGWRREGKKGGEMRKT